MKRNIDLTLHGVFSNKRSILKPYQSIKRLIDSKEIQYGTFLGIRIYPWSVNKEQDIYENACDRCGCTLYRFPWDKKNNIKLCSKCMKEFFKSMNTRPWSEYDKETTVKSKYDIIFNRLFSKRGSY